MASERLKVTQKQLGEKELKLKQDIITRWNSTYMFERILETKKSVLTIIATEYPNTPNFTSEDIDIITNICDLLRHLKSVTEIMSAEKYVTISKIIILANLLTNKCESFFVKDISAVVTNMSYKLHTDLTTRFKNIEDNQLFAVSTLLDPRFKKYGFPKNKKSSVDRTKINLTNLARAVFANNEIATISEDTQNDITETLTFSI